jgi:serine/threonine protein kinase
MPDADPSPSNKPRNELSGLDPGELLARAMNTAVQSGTGVRWVPPEPGELARLLPQYEIESILGQGGMGAVYKGRQPGLDRFVAIKILPAEMASDEQFVKRFQREARLLAKLQHPGIVAVYDSGQTREGHLYFVMEYVEGTDLRRVLKTSQLTADQALELICQICEALQAAHKQGVVHRDIKPENILISSDGNVKLADFGLSRPLNEETIGLTMTNMVMGTPDYMSPEQREGNADERSDIFALGIVLYEMLTGKRPHGAFDPPSFKAQVDVRIDEVVLKALQDEPLRRYQQVSELKTDVDRIRSTPPEVPAAAAPAPKQPRSNAAAYAVGVAAFVLLLCGLLLWAPWRKERKSAEVASIAPVATAEKAPASSDPVPVTDPDRWKNAVNLMPLIALNRDVVRGIWSTKENGLVSGPQGASCIEIPYTPPEEYDFRITFTRLDGSEGVHQILYKAGRSFEWFMGASNRKMGFMRVNDLGIDNPTTVNKPGCIVNGRRYTSVVSVRNDGVTAYLDGVQVDQLKTDYREMSPYPSFTLRTAARLGIGSFSASTVFHSIEVLEVTGKGIVIQTGSSAPAATPAPVPQPDLSGRPFVPPDSLRVAFIPQKSAKLLPVGTQKGGSTMTTDNPVDVFRDQPVIFDQHTGNEVHFTVDSSTPISSLQYTGLAFELFTIRVLDRNGLQVASCGPYYYGNSRKTLDVPLPGLTHFEVVITNYSSVFLLINSIRFSSAPGSASLQGASSANPVPPQATPAPTPDLMAWLLEKMDRWPKEVKLTQPAGFPVMVNGSTKGAITAPAGTTVRVLGLRPGQVSVEWNGSRKDVTVEATDLMQRASAAQAVPPPQSPAPQSAPAADERTQKLKALLDQGLITKDAYDQKIREIQGGSPNPRLQKLKELFDQGLISKEAYDKKAADISQGK